MCLLTAPCFLDEKRLVLYAINFLPIDHILTYYKTCAPHFYFSNSPDKSLQKSWANISSDVMGLFISKPSSGVQSLILLKPQKQRVRVGKRANMTHMEGKEYYHLWDSKTEGCETTSSYPCDCDRINKIEMESETTDIRSTNKTCPNCVDFAWPDGLSSAFMLSHVGKMSMAVFLGAQPPISQGWAHFCRGLEQ